MKARIVRTIFFKELLDTFRDRRTLIAMVGVPVVLYPALFILATQATLIQQSRMEKTRAKVAVTGEDASRIVGWLEAEEKIEVTPSDDPLADLDAGKLDAVVTVPAGVAEALETGGTAEIEIAYDAAEVVSRKASDRIEEVMRKARDALIQDRVDRQGLVATFATPLKLTWENVAPPSKTAGSILGTILPLLMVVMLGVGAFYPAVDLTAGEKERGTFETLLSTPTSKMEIVFGKFFAVFTLSMLTGLLNLASMIATLLFQLTQIMNAAEGSDFALDITDIPPQTFAAILLVLIPLSLFISAMMMTVALLAHSFKEAQNYVTPFFMALIVPASIVAIPGVELTPGTQFIPVGNVSLLFRDLMMGKASLDAVFIVFLVTMVYALIALVIATWMFQREEVILSEESGIPLTFNRDRIEPREVPSLGTSLGIFAVVMLLIFYGATYAQTRHLHVGLVLTQYALILAPVLLAVWYVKADLKATLNLRPARWGAALGTLLMAPAWVVISIQLGVYHNRVLPAPPEMLELAEKLFAVSDLPGGVWTLLFIVAVSPAICEEVLFRGLLLSGFRQRLPQWVAILAVGVLFGFFHLSIYRLIPTGLTGIFFTYLVLRSGSIYLAMFAHVVLNGLSILIETGNFPVVVMEYLENANIEGSGLPLWVGGAALVVFAAGVLLLETTGRSRRSA